MRSRRYSILNVRVKISQGDMASYLKCIFDRLFLIFAVISMFFGLLLVKCKSTDMGIMHSVNLRIRLRGCATAESQTKPQVSSILTAQKITYNYPIAAILRDILSSYVLTKIVKK